MKIKKKSILKAFELFSDVYTEFDKKINTEEKLKSMLDNWIEVFDIIDFDYEEASDDFLKASKILITKNKYTPTISEISDEMKQLYMQRKESYEHELTYTADDFTEEQYARLVRRQMSKEEMIQILKEKKNVR
jgi:hypothetical protein